METSQREKESGFFRFCFVFVFLPSPDGEADQIRMRSGPSYTPPPSSRDICLGRREPTTEWSSPQATVGAPRCPWHLSPLCVLKLAVREGTMVHSPYNFLEMVGNPLGNTLFPGSASCWPQISLPLD